MKILSHASLRNIGVGAFALTAGLAQAHTGHGTTGVFDGLVHPFGLDHLLAMVAVGVVGVRPAGQQGLVGARHVFNHPGH